MKEKRLFICRDDFWAFSYMATRSKSHTEALSKIGATRTIAFWGCTNHDEKEMSTIANSFGLIDCPENDRMSFF